jgi:hypothetical protein
MFTCSTRLPSDVSPQGMDRESLSTHARLRDGQSHWYLFSKFQMAEAVEAIIAASRQKAREWGVSPCGALRDQNINARTISKLKSPSPPSLLIPFSRSRNAVTGLLSKPHIRKRTGTRGVLMSQRALSFFRHERLQSDHGPANDREIQYLMQ